MEEVMRAGDGLGRRVGEGVADKCEQGNGRHVGRGWDQGEKSGLALIIW